MAEKTILIAEVVNQLNLLTTPKMEAMAIQSIPILKVLIRHPCQEVEHTSNTSSHLICLITTWPCLLLSRSQRVSSWRIFAVRFKTERRLRSETSRIMSSNVPWTNMGLDSFSRSMMWPLKRRKSWSSQRYCLRHIVWWMMCLETMLSKNFSNTEIIYKLQLLLNNY